jgi:hypothetical protein
MRAQDEANLSETLSLMLSLSKYEGECGLGFSSLIKPALGRRGQ